jgi:ABC-type polysaccharide/polyol phosphate export permease
MTVFVTAYRGVLLSGELPMPICWIAILIATSASLLLGYFPFLRIRKRLAEEI